MKFHLTFFSSLLIGLLLLSGQAFATPYYSIPGGAGLWSDPATWSGSPCGFSVTTGPVAEPLPGDTLTICDSSAIPGFVIRVDAASYGASATVKIGGTLDLSTNKLDLGAAGVLTNDGGTILSGVQALVAQSIIHNSGTTNLTGVTTNTTNSITVNGPGLTLSPKLIGINGLFTSSANFTMPSTVLSLEDVTVTGGTLTLSSANLFTGTGTVTIDAGNGGAIVGLNQTNTPTITVTPTPSTPLQTCSPGYTLTISTAGTGTCVANPVFSISAPIFSTKEKARVFIEEVR
jgi:hypothetical protein